MAEDGQGGGSREVYSVRDLYVGVHPFPTTTQKKIEDVSILRRFFQDPPETIPFPPAATTILTPVTTS